MILEMTAGVALTYAVASSRGVSPCAQFIAGQSEEARNDFRSTVTLEPSHSEALNELYEIFEECSNPGWDGYGALPVERETYRLAYFLLESLPSGIFSPTVGAEPDGHLTLEWHSSAVRTLSISVSPEHEIHYAALLGASRAFGTEPFTGELPLRVMEIVRNIAAISDDTFALPRA